MAQQGRSDISFNMQLSKDIQSDISQSRRGLLLPVHFCTLSKQRIVFLSPDAQAIPGLQERLAECHKMHGVNAVKTWTGCPPQNQSRVGQANICGETGGRPDLSTKS